MRVARVLASVLISWPLTAQAADAAPRVHLQVIAPAPCADSAALIARVQARTPRVRFAAQNATHVARATFTETPGGQVQGELVLVQQGHTAPTRRLFAASCSDALDGLALILAITLDPEAHADEQNTSTTRNTPEPSTTTESSSQPVTAPAAPSARAALVDTGADTRASAPAKPLHWGFGLSVAAESLAGLAPALLPGVGLAATVSLKQTSLWSPAFTLGAQRVWGGRFTTTAGAASFALDALSADACAVRVQVAPFLLRGCASLLLGRLHVTASETRNSVGTVSRPFAALGASALAQWQVAAPVQLTARLAPRLNLVRDELEFGSQVVHSVGPVSLAASLGVGLAW